MEFLGKLSLRTKILVPVIAVMALLVAATVSIIDRHITKQFEAESKETLTTAVAIIHTLQRVHENNLLQRFRNLPLEPRWRASFQSGDAPTIQFALKDLLQEQDVDMVLYATNTGAVLALESPNPQISGAAFQAAAAALKKTLQESKPETDTATVGGQLYGIASVPVLVDDELIGVLAFGSLIGKEDANEFRSLTPHVEIALLADDRVVATTITGAGGGLPLASLFKNFFAQQNGAEAELLPVNDGRSFYVAGKFKSLAGDPALGYLLRDSNPEPQEALQETRRLLLSASLGSILLGAAVIWFLVNRITRPLLELRASAEAVGRGDYSRRVEVRTRDECGQLATVFNQMTQNVEQAQAQLQQTVNTLKATQAQLVQSEKLSAVGEFVAGVAHDLNNPLAAVMGFAEILKDTGADHKHRHHLELIFKSAKRCQKIVQSLLSFARRHQPERKPVSLNQLIEEVVEIVAYPMRTSNVELVLRLDPKLPLALADGHQIQQVLLNLINNARQAIEAHQPSGRITVTTESNHNLVRIVVQDNGPGIAPDDLKRIFDPFFTTKEVGKGTGLGLSLCYGLIKEHGGNITPASKPGEGAAFTVELPAIGGSSVAESAAVSALPAAIDPREGAGKKILLIDDEDILLDMIRDDLQRRGYEVVSAGNGEAALGELHGQRFDAIFCDVKMAGLNGRQVYERIRGTRAELSRRVIFMTGDIINHSFQLFLEQEQLQCLNKPFALGDLHTALNQVFAEAASRSAPSIGNEIQIKR